MHTVRVNKHPVALVAPEQTAPLANRSVLVTGGTGSFGGAFVRQALADGARRVVIYSRDELKQSAMRAAIPDDRCRWFIGDVRDYDRLLTAMRGVDLVVHAAAMKRIETCEECPDEAIRTNVLGTMHVARATIEAGVQKAVFLSTDKAPAAATLYGATKFCAEKLWIQSNVLAAGRTTKLSAVRYGNVLGSRGSVLDLWRTQARNGQRITITDERCSRFWLTLNQAVDLVLLAFRTMRGGEVLIPKAPSSPILSLAEAVVGRIHLAAVGVDPIGLRAAERLHETLISSDEARTTWDMGNHYVIEPESRTWGEVAPPNGTLVPADFSYRSDTNTRRYTADQLRALVA